ncbi:MAG TPA: FtsX-like permease family protein [Vicinamibacteria bacterium]|nr:FtsX-like permease family protein [Vicinamibacteria bacterium]
MSELLRRLFDVIGRRAFLAFGTVTFLVGALLATVNVTSRYAIKRYVDDQLARIHWDAAVYQTEGYDADPTLAARLRREEGIVRVESLAFLRTNPPEGQMAFTIDGQRVGTPWVSVLAATTPSLLPPVVQAALRDRQDGVALALVGPERAMGKAFLALQGAKEIRFDVSLGLPGGVRGAAAEGHAVTAFARPITSVVRLERDDLNRWLMDRVGAISFVPHVGLTLLMPYDDEVLRKFEDVSTGTLTEEVAGEHAYMGHQILAGEYMPEVVHVALLDRAGLVSGWDVPRSRRNVAAALARLSRTVESSSVKASLDSVTLVLLERMEAVGRLIGVLTVLIALPLLWMAWVLAGHLSGLLMLNERRRLGLMRLRGVPGAALGRAFLLAIGTGGLLGSVLGVAAGAVGSLLVYERGRLPLFVLLDRRQLVLLAAYVVVTLGLALVVSRRLVRYATTISPLEASGRVAMSEAARARVAFRLPQLLALLLGALTVYSWMTGYRPSTHVPLAAVRLGERALDFLGLPLFIYGAAALLASRASLIRALLTPLAGPIGGRLGPLALRHLALKPHRALSFLLIVGLMASLALYPQVTSSSFSDRARRGAHVQVGGDLQVIFNAPELASAERLKGPLSAQVAALRPEIARIVAALRATAGVADATWMLEGILPGFYLPGQGLEGVPAYLLDDVDDYLRIAYSEPALGVGAPYREIVSALDRGAVLVSPSVAGFWRVSTGTTVDLGMDRERRTLSAPAAGTAAFLAGMPPLTVNDRASYVQSRIDYLNHLFAQNAYTAVDADSAALAGLEVLIPRVVVLLRAAPGARLRAVEEAVRRAPLPFRPLEVNTREREEAKVGSDMFIALALQNMKIFLIGGLVLAVVAIVAVALANYVEDRRTIALLRVRGASPGAIWRFFVASLVSPALLGLLLGAAVALAGGFGLASHVWRLRELKTVVHLLPTRLVVSGWTMLLGASLLALVVAVAWLFSSWVFRRTAREDILEA